MGRRAKFPSGGLLQLRRSTARFSIRSGRALEQRHLQQAVLRFQRKFRRCVTRESDGDIRRGCTVSDFPAAIIVKKWTNCEMPDTIHASHCAFFQSDASSRLCINYIPMREPTHKPLHPVRHAQRDFPAPGSSTLFNSARKASARLRMPTGTARAGISDGSMCGSEWKIAGRIEAFHKCVRLLCSTVYATKVKTRAMTTAG